MNNIALINCTNLTEYSFKKLVNGKSSIDSVVEYISTLEDLNKAVIITENENTESFLRFKSSAEIIGVEDFDNIQLFSLMQNISEGFDNIFYVYGDCPFLDTEASMRMYRNHLKYFAQYSFSDGCPYGIMPEIISTEIAGALKVLAEKKSEKVLRDTVFKTIQKDINSFDIETDISEKDMRLLRISLTADSKRNFLLLKRLSDRNIAGEKEIISFIEENGEILRTLPAFYQIQISGKCYQKCSYCPYSSINPDLLDSSEYMTAASFKIILDKIKSFSDDAVISLSFWGEPLANPELEKIIDLTMEYEQFSLMIETSGVGLKKEAAAEIAEKYGSRITWIISLDTGNEELYRSIRGEGFSEAVEAADFLLSKFPETAYVQAVRMKETEDHLEEFYKSWKLKTENVIIQKYNNFSGSLEDRKVTDISPLKRFPCWHLKRDLSVFINGDVPVCGGDLEKKNICGNIFENEIEDIWEKGETLYNEHLSENYPGLCRECDEYYTYNF